MRLFWVVGFLTMAAVGGSGRADWACEIIGESRELAALSAASPPTAGKAKVLYYRVAYFQSRGSAQAPNSEAEAQKDMEGANAYLERVSHQRFSLEWTITKLLVLPHDQLYYEQAGGPELILQDARAAAQAEGYLHTDYDLDLIRLSSIAGSEAGGLGKIGQRGAWVEKSGPYIIAHELLHNLGLLHANLWRTAAPDSNSLRYHPSNTKEADLTRYPRDPDALIGRESVYGPGESDEYGDPFDIMGTGGESAINAVFQAHLGWIGAEQVQAIRSNAVVRLHAMDVEARSATSILALRLATARQRGRVADDYWIEYRTSLATNAPSVPGVLLRWARVDQPHGPALLLDADPGGVLRQRDSTLKLGRTYSDPLADLHVTPIAAGTDDRAPWIDVEVNFGPFPSNRAPVLFVKTPPEQVQTNTPVSFVPESTDPDGDELSWFWEFGDGTYSASRSAVQKSWAAAGDYVVRLEVSDRKGGTVSKHFAVRVGQPATHRISGQVRDPAGNPVAGVRVHNGIYSRNPGTANYQFMVTDSEGRYTLTGLKAGAYSNAAVHLNYECTVTGDDAPILIGEQSRTGIDFIARPIPVISLALRDASAREGTNTTLTIRRSGSTGEAVTAKLIVAGAAQSFDYVLHHPWVVPVGLASSGEYEVRFPAGGTVAEAEVQLSADNHAEGDETVVFALQWPSSYSNAAEPGVKVPLPGWDLQMRRGEWAWVQSSPQYGLQSSQAALTIVDGPSAPPDPAPADVLSIARNERTGGLTVWTEGVAGRRHVLETSGDPAAGWSPLRTNNFFVNRASFEINLPLTNQARFFRSRVE